jgi:hypothetical protein
MEPSDSSRLLRRLLLVVITFGLVMTGVDLILLEHYEDSSMLIPLMLIALSLVVIVVHSVAGGAGTVRLLQGVMVLLVAAGALGVYLHFQGNLEFQIEIDPSLSQWELFNKVIRAKAPPALAPGAMAQLGLLGLVYCYRHPALRRDTAVTTTGVRV